MVGSFTDNDSDAANLLNNYFETLNFIRPNLYKTYENMHILLAFYAIYRGGSRVWKEGGGGDLAEKQMKTKKKKKKKVTTIIASYPLPNISRLLCKIKSYL